jgi:hypothetical protein
MIPGDLAARLRMLTEASFFSGEPNVAPLARVKAISDQLPAFTPGQRVVANLQTAYPGNTYQARIDGREVTLALPQAVNAGDTLELVVSHVTPRAVFATLAQPTTSAGTAAATPALSQTGRLISFLLTGQPAAQTAALNGGQPLLAAAPQGPGDSALLASRLSTALEQSGLFYESHQARWLAGKLDTAALMQEPQGRSPMPPATPAAAPGGTETITTPRAANEGLAPIPERLLPLVHQQLDAVATQNFVWQGQVWPGQTMEWEIEDPAADGRSGDEPDQNWTSTLRLTLPRLGGVEARLHLTPAGVAMRLIADSDTTRQALAAAETRLADALAAADVPLTGLVAELRSPP